MKELQRKQRMRRILYSWPSLVLAAVITFFLVKGATGVMLKERKSAERVRNLESQAKELESRQGELESSIARLQTEDGILEEIREKFSVSREGEYVAIIVDEKKATTTVEQTTGERFRGWWESLKGLWRE
jgi:cell division protein FtsB